MAIRTTLLVTTAIFIGAALSPAPSKAGQRYLSQSVVELSGIPSRKAAAAPMSEAARKTRVDLVRAGATLSEQVEPGAGIARVAIVEPAEPAGEAEEATASREIAMEEPTAAQAGTVPVEFEETAAAEREPDAQAKGVLPGASAPAKAASATSAPATSAPAAAPPAETVETAEAPSSNPVIEPGALDDIVLPAGTGIAKTAMTPEQIEEADRLKRNTLRLKARAARQDRVTEASRGKS